MLNDGLRESRIEPQVDDLPAHQLNVVTESLAFSTFNYLMLHPGAPVMTDRWLIGLGGAWVAAVVAFV